MEISLVYKHLAFFYMVPKKICKLNYKCKYIVAGLFSSVFSQEINNVLHAAGQMVSSY